MVHYVQALKLYILHTLQCVYSNEVTFVAVLLAKGLAIAVHLFSKSNLLQTMKVGIQETTSTCNPM